MLVKLEKTVHRLARYLIYGFAVQLVMYQIAAAEITDKHKNNGIKTQPTSKFTQDVTLRGQVIDEGGNPIPGAAILVKGTSMGTSTDIEGEFSLEVSGDAVLVISFLGFVTQEIQVGNQTDFEITLLEDTAQLEEVVVVGYGTKTKATLTGAISTLDVENLESRPIANVTSGLQGLIPGLVVQTGSGQPGNEGFNITLRGASSIGGGNSPLVLVDGIQSSLANINPNDIESLSVLKDAAASIYGNQAAGGVILITTKKGKKGKPVVKYETSYAITTPTALPEKLSIREFLDMTNDGRANDGDQIFWGQQFYDAIGTNRILNFSDWELGGAYRADSWLTFNNPENELADLVFKNGERQNHNISLSGGGENSTYFVSLGYLNEKGLINANYDGFDRYNIRLNYTYNISEKLTLTTQNALELGNRSRNTETNNALVQVEQNIPFFPLKRPDGEWYRFRGFPNPMNLLENGSEEAVTSNRIISNYQLDYDILEGLKLTAAAGINNQDIQTRANFATFGFYNTYSPELGGTGNGGYANNGTDPGPTGFYNTPNSLREIRERQTFINYKAFLNYDKTFSDVHNIGVTAGLTHEQTRNNQISAFIRNFPTNDLFALGLGDQDEARVNQDIETFTLRGMFTRLSYNFKDRYYLEGIIRQDQSSRFNKENRTGVFPGYLFAWRASEEDFIKNLNIFDNLKFRVTYGETGNQNGLGLYDYLALVNLSINNPTLFGPATGNTNPANPDCTTCGLQNENPYYTEVRVVSNERSWETLATTNFGIDVSVLDSRLDLSFDYFIKRNKNMLVGINLPTVLGAFPPTLNIGELETKGWEFTIGWRDNVGDFNYYVNGNLFDSTNELISLQGSAQTRSIGINNRLEGYSLNTYFGYQFEGVITNQEQLDNYIATFPNGGIPNPNATFGAISIGDAMYADLDGNGQLNALGNPEDGDTGDLVELGNSDPRYNYGINLGGEYKGFDFRVFLQGVGKRTIFKSGTFSAPIANGFWFYPGLKYWANNYFDPETNPGSNFPAASMLKAGYNYTVSNNTKLNAAYLRLKNIQLGYSLPSETLNKIGLSKLRLYVSGENLLTFDGIDNSLNFDPESGGASLSYPFAKTYALGLQVNF